MSNNWSVIGAVDCIFVQNITKEGFQYKLLLFFWFCDLDLINFFVILGAERRPERSANPRFQVFMQNIREYIQVTKKQFILKSLFGDILDKNTVNRSYSWSLIWHCCMYARGDLMFNYKWFFGGYYSVCLKDEKLFWFCRFWANF